MYFKLMGKAEFDSFSNYFFRAKSTASAHMRKIFSITCFRIHSKIVLDKSGSLKKLG